MQVLFSVGENVESDFRKMTGAEELLNALSDCGISWRLYHSGSSEAVMRLDDSDPADTVVVTDSEDLAAEACRKGFCVVGLRQQEQAEVQLPLGQKTGKWFKGVKTVCSSAEAVSPLFLWNSLRRSNHLPAVIAETKRLIIRESIPDDFEKIWEIRHSCGPDSGMGDPCSDKESERDQFHAYIRESYDFFGYGYRSVCLKSMDSSGNVFKNEPDTDTIAGRIIGLCGLAPLCDSSQNLQENPEGPELGYLIDPAERQRGFGEEACRAVLEYAACELGFEELYARIAKTNQASVRLAQKLGFTCLGGELWMISLRNSMPG